MSKTRCPICDAAMPGNSQEYPDYPFCSKRCRIIDLGRWLGDQLQGRDELLRVVFDAQKSPAPSAESDHRGVKVRFAYRQTADELIEELIRQEPHPDRITVVSNDGQVQEAARHRGCAVLT